MTGAQPQLSRRYPERGHEITVGELCAHIVQRDLERALRPEFDAIAVTRVLLRSDRADEIMKTARDENVDLTIMSTRGEGAPMPLSVRLSDREGTARNPLRVWTSAHVEDTPVREFSIRPTKVVVVLCQPTDTSARPLDPIRVTLSQVRIRLFGGNVVLRYLNNLHLSTSMPLTAAHTRGPQICLVVIASETKHKMPLLVRIDRVNQWPNRAAELVIPTSAGLNSSGANRLL